MEARSRAAKEDVEVGYGVSENCCRMEMRLGAEWCWAADKG